MDFVSTDFNWKKKKSKRFEEFEDPFASSISTYNNKHQQIFKLRMKKILKLRLVPRKFEGKWKEK